MLDKEDKRQGGYRITIRDFLIGSFVLRFLKATDGFLSENLIGAGSFGSVYKGVLQQENILEVAVKVLNLQTSKLIKSFTAKCAVLKTIRHRKLVKLLTACSSIDFQGNDLKALVYEFMTNRSLEEWLH